MGRDRGREGLPPRARAGREDGGHPEKERELGTTAWGDGGAQRRSGTARTPGVGVKRAAEDQGFRVCSSKTGVSWENNGPWRCS